MSFAVVVCNDGSDDSGDCLLEYRDDKGTIVTLNPEWPSYLNEATIMSPVGHFDSHPGHGEFKLFWSPHEIIIRVAKYGDGDGGCLQVILDSPSSSLRASLQIALLRFFEIQAARSATLKTDA